ncbi:MAG TPA: hypothetical protein VGD78_04280 [Chthoniobacterales bacterium]
MSAVPGHDPFFGVYDRKGGCIAVGQSSDAAVEAARHHLALSSAQEVMNQCSVVHIDRGAYERFLQP